MAQPLLLDRQQLDIAFSEVTVMRRRLPEAALADLAQEVVTRVASNLRDQIAPDWAPGDAEIDALCRALLSSDPNAAVTQIEQARRDGVSYDALCLAYLAVASQRLGEWWTADRITFYKVTIAAGRIYAILRILRLQQPMPVTDGRRAAVFASVPGETHTLGITIAADLARSRGWDVSLLTSRGHDELVADLERSDTAVIGLSASGARSQAALIRLIVALRLSNPRARILVCGQIAALGLVLGGITGADFVTADLEAALDYMDGVVGVPQDAPCPDQAQSQV